MAGERIRTADPVQLAPHDVLLMPTDGVFETQTHRHEFFGIERMLDTIRASQSLSSFEIMRDLRRAARSFAGDVAQKDDMTVVVIKIESDESES